MNSKHRLLFQMHIMWYESQMVPEILDSIQRAQEYSTLPIDYVFCLNAQTYIESPLVGGPEDMFGEFLNHPIIKSATSIQYKSNSDPFYNIGDWRRETYDSDAKYTIWGETDCLLPEDFFYILSNVSIDSPHILSFASRKMWDNTWDCVEHEYVAQFNREPNNPYTAPTPFNADDVINQYQLNELNDQYESISIEKLGTCKIDGSLLSLSSGLPTPFIPENMHFVREDTCAEIFFNLHGIPQYHVRNRMKGHNYKHPLKRMNTDAQRTDDVYKTYEKESLSAMNGFLQKTYNKMRGLDE